MKRFALSLVVVLILLFAVGCGGQATTTTTAPATAPATAATTAPTPTTAPVSTEPIKIGFLTDLTSFLAVDGIPAKKAATLALEEVGSKVAGRPVELLVEDDASDPAIALQRLKKLVENDKISMFIGPFHGGASAAATVYADKVGIPHLTAWFNLNYVDEIAKSKWTWAPWGSGEQLGYAAGVYAAEVLGYKTASTMGTDYVFGRALIGGFKEGFVAGGGEVIQEQWLPMDTKDTSSYIGAIKKVDVVVPWFAGDAGIVGLAQISKLLPTMPVVMPENGSLADPAQVVQFGPELVGVYTSEAYNWQLPGTTSKTLAEAYKARWGDYPNGAAGGAYWGVKIALEALNKTGGDTSPDALAKALDETDLAGPVGTFSFDGRMAPSSYFIEKGVKVNDTMGTEIVAYYTVGSENVGGKLVPKIIEKKILK